VADTPDEEANVFARSRVIVAVTACAAAGAMVLTGCGSSGGGTGAGNGGGESTPAAAGTTPAGTVSTPAGAESSSGGQSAADLVPAAVKSKGTITIALDASYPPMEFFKPGSKTIIGADADLGNALGEALGLKVQEKNVTFDSIIPGLSSGKYDVGLSSFTDTKAREKVVDFVTYFSAGESFYIKASNSKTYDGLDSLCGAKVAVENGTTEQTDAQNQSKKCTSEGKPAVTVLQFSDQSGANLAVSSGRADVGFADSPPVDYIVQSSNGQFKNTGTPFGVAPYGIALPKGNGMAQAVQAALTELIANGKYAAILKQWNLTDGAITSPVINGATS
jgi:polar amino acid transport system substrate-binding protein